MTARLGWIRCWDWCCDATGFPRVSGTVTRQTRLLQQFARSGPRGMESAVIPPNATSTAWVHRKMDARGGAVPGGPRAAHFVFLTPIVSWWAHRGWRKKDASNGAKLVATSRGNVAC